MSDSPEIQVERQAGGWIWIALAVDPDGGPSLVLHHSKEAFASEEAARCDAEKVLRKLGSSKTSK
ncbi:hypothetical protein [Caballeronia sp. AZ7_KS35]|uniref:hypothetical protein n=1 Tax=Caballeronia sp. AZ7_KS35 TaxID=2921762 RepID=UPI0020284204|nr:hypothetical protein [Caballeronia sp. AZ7_KS35]